MAKGLIFDFGGTLDTHGCHWGKMLWHAYQRQEVPVSEALFRDAYVYGERYLGSHKIIQPEMTFRQTLQIKLETELKHLSSATRQSLEYYAEPLLDDLLLQVKKTMNISRKILTALYEKYPLVLVSNFYGNLQTILKEFSIHHLFKDIIESDVVGIRKPDPRIFQLGVDALRLRAEETIVVGDSISKDIIPSKEIGCRNIWIKGEGWTDTPSDENIPDAIITRLEGLYLLA